MRHHAGNPQIHRLCALAALASLVLACDGLVGADVECEKICITAVGPTVPGLSVPVDGGVPNGLAAQPATMEFNVPLSQLSKAVAEVDVEAYLSSLRLMAPADLAFVESAQIILRAGTTDGGVRPADAATTPVNPAAPDAATAITTPPPGPIDGGPMPILEDELPNIRADACLPGGQGFTVGTYRKPVPTRDRHTGEPQGLHQRQGRRDVPVNVACAAPSTARTRQDSSLTPGWFLVHHHAGQ
jgi:hypothetical protein